jgi:hypothetical protein
MQKVTSLTGSVAAQARHFPVRFGVAPFKRIAPERNA